MNALKRSLAGRSPSLSLSNVVIGELRPWNRSGHSAPLASRTLSASPCTTSVGTATARRRSIRSPDAIVAPPGVRQPARRAHGHRRCLRPRRQRQDRMEPRESQPTASRARAGDHVLARSRGGGQVGHWSVRHVRQVPGVPIVEAHHLCGDTHHEKSRGIPPIAAFFPCDIKFIRSNVFHDSFGTVLFSCELGEGLVEILHERRCPPSELLGRRYSPKMSERINRCLVALPRGPARGRAAMTVARVASCMHETPSRGYAIALLRLLVPRGLAGAHLRVDRPWPSPLSSRAGRPGRRGERVRSRSVAALGAAEPRELGLDAECVGSKRRTSRAS